MYIERELSLESEVRFVYPRKMVSVEEDMTKPAQTVQQVVEVKEKRGMELGPLISTNRKYSEDYQGQSPIEEQIRNLASLLNLDSSQALAYAKELLEPISEGEGWFAIISDNGLKKLFPNIEEDRRYFFGVELVHKKLAELHKPINEWFSGDISPNNLRVHERTKKAMGIIAKEQHGDILILSCQLGDRFPGFSPDRAIECLTYYEFALGSLATGCILLNHPERIGGIFTLGMLCPGDVILNSDGDNQVPYYSPSLFPWWWHCSFGTIKACEASPKFGNITAFVSRDISLND